MCPVHYWHIVYIMQVITEDLQARGEGNGLNFFGGYSDPHLKAWGKARSILEKRNVRLAEAARAMTQIATYDVPAIRKDMHALEKRIKDAVRKHQDYERGITESERKLQESCKELRIDGVSFRAEVQ